MRWQLLRRGSRVRGKARVKLDALVASKLATARAWTLKDCFEYFWHYKSPLWAGSFLDYWPEFHAAFTHYRRRNALQLSFRPVFTGSQHYTDPLFTIHSESRCSV